MATWEDGPEYAPTARPDHFAEATATPLSEVAPPPPSSAPAPAERPRFDDPAAPVAALEALVPPREEQRDPAVPFDVASSTMTEATSAWSAAHWSRGGDPPGIPTPPDPIDYGPEPGTWSPASRPYPPPPPATQPFPPPPASGQWAVAPEAGPGGFPAPGTEQWFAPPPPPTGAPTLDGRTGAGAIATALTPAVIICLVIGGIVWPLAPITFALAAGLAVRMRAGRSVTRIIFGIGLALLGCVLLVGILLGDGLFGDWWELLSRWAQALCWIMLVVAWIVVYRDLRTPRYGAGPPPGNWG
jgi:hypothetical protein